ncbi:MAG: DUF1704 domain-containing protein, partial [Akkermansiaceae bacterium]|nr:DUF1704 domain-containing protein [Akkermansiaceae bacterium]
MPGLLSSSRLDELNAHCLGLEVQPVFRNLQTGEFFPLVWRTLHRDLSHALRRTFFAFTQGQTTHRPPHYHALGRRAVTKAVWEIDGKLAGISDSFDFLLQVSPINTEEGWRWFKAHRFEKAPVFHYRPLPIDPPSLKGQLYRIDLDRIEDPSLGALFRDKRAELDRQLTMLLDRDTRNFFYGSLQLYGPVDERTRTMAEGVLGRLPGEVQDELLTGEVAAEEFAQRARAELDRYRAVLPEDGCEVIVTGEVAGLMVSKGCLLVSPGIRVPADRVEALIEHEVGTHILTWQNARQQRFRLLASGLADYDELQEGLAVLAEYLCGGLTAERMRLLAGRVVACHHLQEGATFIETYRRLVNEHNFERRTAYRITTRVYRGGGLMKDAVY